MTHEALKIGFLKYFKEDHDKLWEKGFYYVLQISNKKT